MVPEGNTPNMKISSITIVTLSLYVGVFGRNIINSQCCNILWCSWIKKCHFHPMKPWCCKSTCVCFVCFCCRFLLLLCWFVILDHTINHVKWWVNITSSGFMLLRTREWAGSQGVTWLHRASSDGEKLRKVRRFSDVFLVFSSPILSQCSLWCSV